MAHRNKAFTLIELLVVISIIGLLASIVLTSLNSARQKAKNAKKQSDLSQILKAVQVYYTNSTNGSMPVNVVPGNWCYIGQSGCLQELVTSGFYTTLPQSPDSDVYYYYDYGTFGMMASHMTPEQYGPGTRGWHCSDTAGGVSGSKYYCYEFDK